MATEDGFKTYDPEKYRIIKITEPDGTGYYIFQRKILWWWWDWHYEHYPVGMDWEHLPVHYPTFEKAKEALLAKIDRYKKNKKEVILDKKG